MSFSDDFDPYAPKGDGTNSVRADKISLNQDFTVGDVLSRSWQILRSRMGLILGTCFTSIFLSSLPNIIASIISPDDQNAPPNPLAMLLILVGSIFGVYLQCGMFTFLINLASGRKAEFNDLFRGGPIVIKAILGSLLLSVAGVAVFAVGFGMIAILFQVAGAAGVAAGVLVLICAASVIFTRFSQYFYLLVDREVGVIESFNLSSQLMRGRFWQYNILLLTCGLINLLTIFSLGIGLLLTIPLTLISSAVFYLAITGQPVADPMALGANAQEDFV